MRSLIFLTIGMFAVGSSSFMIAGLLPLIGQTIDQSIAVTSLGISAFGLTYLFSAPLFSMIFANRSAKQVLQMALLVFIFGNVISLSSESIFQFVLGRVLTGLGAGIFNPLCVSIAIHLGSRSAKGRGQILSLIWGANSAGVVFGVPLGLYLSSYLNWQSSIGYVVVLSLLALVGFSMQKADINLPKSPSIKERLLLLVDQRVMQVIGITCLTTMAGLGLYSYVAPIHSGVPHSLTVTLFIWGLGGFIGSSFVGTLVDRTENPRAVMAFILSGLTLTFIILPFVKNIPYLGLLPFFFWGVFGWATTTPQQHILFGLQEHQGTLLTALNSSAIGLGSAVGTAVGGIVIASGWKVVHLPFLAATLLFGTLICQIILIKTNQLGSFARE